MTEIERPEFEQKPMPWQAANAVAIVAGLFSLIICVLLIGGGAGVGTILREPLSRLHPTAAPVSTAAGVSNTVRSRKPRS